MSLAKLLGLPQTKDSIIVRGVASPTVRMLPRTTPDDRAVVEDGDTNTPRRVLRRLIAVRKIGEKK